MSAYDAMKATIEAVLPDGWKFTAYEPLIDLPDVTGVTMKIRSVAPLEGAPRGAYRVDWVLTITSHTKNRETSDPTLFDDLIKFLGALDTDDAAADVVWTEATKAVGDDDERLAYDITVRSHMQTTTDSGDSEPG